VKLEKHWKKYCGVIMKEIFQVQKIAVELDVVSERYSRLNWVKYTTGYDFGVEEAYQAILKILMDKTRYKIILEHLGKDLSLENKRRVEILEKGFRNFHLSPELNRLSKRIQQKSNELSHLLNTHRNKIAGREVNSVEITRIISESENEDLRKEAFLSRASVNKPLIDAGFIELLDMRKEFARIYGARDFVYYSLEQAELDPSIFDCWASEVRKHLPDLKKAGRLYAERYLDKSTIMPWDAAYLSGKIAPELNKEIDMTDFYRPIERLFGIFGIDLSQDNTTYDVFPRKNKSEWGYNFTIKPGIESRILANVQNRYNQFGVLLHETGHAMHYARLNPQDLILNSGVSGIIAEGIANLFGDFLSEEIFFAEFFKDDIEKARNNFAALKLWQRINALTAIENILFDQALYLNPINNLEDIHNLKWKLYEDLLDKKPYAAEPVWGYVIHHTTHPIYLHNYFMGDVTSEMLKQVFCKKYDAESLNQKPREFGSFLYDEVIKPAGLYPYAQLFRKISGEDFSLKYLTANVQEQL
jgi:oligoendopeptidase F